MPKRSTFSVGLIGTGFMGKVHSNAWRQAPRFFDLAAKIRMTTICGRDRAGTSRAAKKLGWEGSTTDWRVVIADPGIDIVDICAPNDLHAEIAIAAARAGKAILCEKPPARNKKGRLGQSRCRRCGDGNWEISERRPLKFRGDAIRARP